MVECHGKASWRWNVGGGKMVRYEPAFLRVRTFARLPNVQDLKNAGAAVVGAPFGTGKTFCVGIRFGPEGIRSVSHQT
jgi:arginase family enzyme